MGWDDGWADLEAQRDRAAAHDGDDPATARRRIKRLVDPGSFVEVGRLVHAPVRDELGRLAGSLPGGSACGLAGIDGRLVAVAAVGPVRPATEPLRKLAEPKTGWDGAAERLALDHRIPLVLLLDGWGGGHDSVGRLAYPYLVSGIRTRATLELLQQAPVVVGVLGPVAGVTAARVVASHFSVVLRDGGRVFASTAQEAAALDGDDAEARGGAGIQAGRAGNVDNVAETEDDLYDQIRLALSYLPSNVSERPPYEDCDDDPDRPCDGLQAVLPENAKAPYDVRAVVGEVVDHDTFFELAPGYGGAVVAGFARLGGEAVGILASDPAVLAGAMDAAACEKTTRMFERFDQFHLPVVCFVDVPGLMIGEEAERSGLFRRAFRTLQAAHRVTTPVFSVVVRRSYGVGGMLLGSPNDNGHILTWPGAEWGDMPIEGGAAALYGRELAAAADPEKLLAELEERLRAGTSSWGTAASFGLGDVIHPRETRQRLCRLVAAAVAHRPASERRGPAFRP